MWSPLHGITLMKTKATPVGLALLLAVTSGCCRLQASQITWASNAFADNLQSNGLPLTDEFLFFLGTFATGFTPTAANTSEWSSKWSTLEISAYNTTSARFAASTDYITNVAPFFAGVRGYIWGCNGKCGAGEWILLGNNTWRFPVGASGPAAPTVTWSASQADQVITGSVGVGGAHLRTAAVGANTPPALTPLLWRALWFSSAELLDSTISGWDADPDKDRVLNLAEYATGTSPKSYSARALTETSLAAGGSRLDFSLARDCRSPALWSPQESTHLENWIPTGSDILKEPMTPSGYRLGLPLTSGLRRFVRFNFTLP